MLKYTVVAAVVALAGTLTAMAQQKPDFSGEWELNRQTSMLSPTVAPVARDIDLPGDDRQHPAFDPILRSYSAIDGARASQRPGSKSPAMRLSCPDLHRRRREQPSSDVDRQIAITDLLSSRKARTEPVRFP